MADRDGMDVPVYENTGRPLKASELVIGVTVLLLVVTLGVPWLGRIPFDQVARWYESYAHWASGGHW